MKNRKFKKYPLVLIEWYDHAGEGGWVEMKDLEEDTGTKNVTNNSLFVGSTSDLQKMLKEMSKSK